MTNKRQINITEVKIILEVFSQGQHTEAAVQKRLVLNLKLQADLGNMQASHMVVVLVTWKLQKWRGHIETRRGHGEGVASVAVKTPRTEGVVERIWGLAPCEAWRGHWWKYGLSCNGDLSRLEMPGQWDVYQGQRQVWSGAGLSLWNKLHVLWMAEPEKWSYLSLLEPEDHDWVPDVQHWATLLDFGLLKFAWFFPLR